MDLQLNSVLNTARLIHLHKIKTVSTIENIYLLVLRASIKGSLGVIYSQKSSLYFQMWMLGSANFVIMKYSTGQGFFHKSACPRLVIIFAPRDPVLPSAHSSPATVFFPTAIRRGSTAKRSS